MAGPGALVFFLYFVSGWIFVDMSFCMVKL